MMGMESVKKGTKMLRSEIARKEKDEIINNSLHFLFIGCAHFFHFMRTFSQSCLHRAQNHQPAPLCTSTVPGT